MQINLLHLDNWLIIIVSQLLWFHSITTDSTVHESSSHVFFFLVLIHLICQDHVRPVVRLGTRDCSGATSSALSCSLLRDTVQDLCSFPSTKLSKRCFKSKIALQRVGLRFGDARGVRRVVSAVVGQAECLCHGSCKAVGGHQHHRYHSHIRVQKHFCWSFLQKHALKELQYSSGSKAGYNCKDVIGTDMEVC